MTPAVSTRTIIAAAAARHGVKPEHILGKSRLTRIVQARHAAIRAVALSRPYTTGQLKAIFGLHHSTLIWALGRRQTVRQPKSLREGVK